MGKIQISAEENNLGNILYCFQSESYGDGARRDLGGLVRILSFKMGHDREIIINPYNVSDYFENTIQLNREYSRQLTKEELTVFFKQIYESLFRYYQSFCD